MQTIGLPNDPESNENELIIIQELKSALIIDPQNQTTVWIKNLENQRYLVCLKPSSPNFYRTIKVAASLGNQVLLEDMQESINPGFDSLLMRKYYKQE